MTDPIVALIAGHKEGSLIQGAIRSALKAQPHFVIVYDCPVTGVKVEGEPTNLGKSYTRYLSLKDHEFPTQYDMRNAMLGEARRKMRGHPFWTLILDADEVLVWGEYLPDWLGQLKPGYPHSMENLIPLKLTGFVNDVAMKVPSRVVHSSLIDEYLCGCWVFSDASGNVGVLGHTESEFMPAQGEPHIHHRHHMRRPERKSTRLSGQSEEDEFKADPGMYMLEHHGIEGFTLNA